MPCCEEMSKKDESLFFEDQRSLLGHCLSFEGEDSFQRKKDIETTTKTPVPPKTPVKFSPWFRVERKASLVTFKSDRSDTLPLSDLYNRHSQENYMDQVFKDVQQVGEGHFGKVYRVVSREDGKVYAVKVSKEIFHNENERSKRFEEVRKHEMIPVHPNCVRLYNAWEEQARLYLWMEFCDTSLEDYAAKNHEISEWKVWEILLDLLLGLKNLHDNRLVHVDVKLENILMTAEGVCKLADFGLLVDMSQDSLPPKNIVEGDGRYLAPELLRGGPFSAAVDVFSLGLCILELAADIVMPQGGEDWQMLRRGEIPAQKTTHLSGELKGVITQMLTPDHLLRPSVDLLLTQPRLQQMWCERRKQSLMSGMKLRAPITDAVRRKCGRPQRACRQRPVMSSVLRDKSFMRRRFVNGSTSAAGPRPNSWNMQVSDDELEVAAMLEGGQLDVLASSTPFKPPTPTWNRGLRSIPSSHRTLNFAMNDSASSSSPLSSPRISPTAGICSQEVGGCPFASLNSVGENLRISPASLCDSPCAFPDFTMPLDTGLSHPQSNVEATPQLATEYSRPLQSRTLPITGRNLLCSFNSSEEESDEEVKVGIRKQMDEKKKCR